MTTAIDADLAAEAEAIRSRPRLVRAWWVLRHHDRPVRFLLARLLTATGLSQQLLIRRDGFDLRFHDSSISMELWLHGNRPNPTEQLFRAYLKPGDYVVDVGANIGFYTMVSSVAVGASGQVIAIEADPRVAAFLRSNIALNKATNVDVRNVAVGDSSGWLHFSDDRQDDRNCVVNGDGGRRVEVMRLDTAVAPRGTVALLKIDVEGYEKFVLDGATGLLPRVRCVFIETWAEHFARYGYECRDVHERLLAHGFDLFRLNGQALTPVAAGYVSTVCEDLIAVRDAGEFTRRTGYAVRR
jgi:FkbM family methyltransferase